MGKHDRLQLRIDPDLKEWFKDYSDERGGMSRVVQDHIKYLKKRHGKKDNGQDHERGAETREACSGL